MGANELKALWSLVYSNIGLVAGVTVTIMGLYQMLVKGNTGWGMTLMIIGVGIPFLGNFMTGFQTALCPIITDLGGTCTNFATGAGGGTSNILM